MLTIKILCKINSLKKNFRQNTIYNSFRLKTLNFDQQKNSFNQKIFQLKTFHFN